MLPLFLSVTNCPICIIVCNSSTGQLPQKYFLHLPRPSHTAIRNANSRQKIAQLSADDSSSSVKRFVILRQRMANLPAEDYFFGA
ncbi:MAG: hypothetical protein RR365_15200, partial [Bacteroides sp.]